MSRIAPAVAMIGAVTLLTGTASAVLQMSLGGGWQATIIDSDHVSLLVESVSLFDDVLVLHKIADFTSLDPFTGAPLPTSILFTQISPDASTVSHIVIDDEVITNHTGLAWGGFSNALLGSAATFNPGASSTFSTAPFTTTQYSPALDQVTYAGGLIPNGGMWTPGIASGALWINVDLGSASPASFVLKEIPQVPVPGSLSLISAALTIGRRRSRS